MNYIPYEQLYNICLKIYNELYKKQKFVEDIWNYIDGNNVKKISYKKMKYNNEILLLYQIYKLATTYKYKHKNYVKIYDITDDINIMIYQFELFIMLMDEFMAKDYTIHEFMTPFYANIVTINEHIKPQHRVALTNWILLSFKYIDTDDDFIAFGYYMSPVMFFYKDKICKIRDDKEDVFDNEIRMYKIMQKQSNNFALYINNYPEFFTLHWDTLLQPFINFDYNKEYINSILQVFSNLRIMKFYHGDLKCNNIMINISTLEVQIIDLEHSKILQSKNKIIWDDVVINYFDRENDCYCDEYVYFSDRILELYDMYKFVISLCYNFNIIWNDYKFAKGIIMLDFLVFSMLCSNDEIQYVTSIIDMKDLFVCPCTKAELQCHYDEMKRIIYKEVIRNEP